MRAMSAIIAPVRMYTIAIVCILFASPLTDAIHKTTSGCADKITNMTMTLECPILFDLVTIIDIFSISVTYKDNCPVGDEVDGCGELVDNDNPFYVAARERCENKTSCTLIAERLHIDVCDSDIAHSNFMRVIYNCFANGETATMISTSTSTSTTQSSVFNETTQSSVFNETCGGDSQTGANSSSPLLTILIPLSVTLLIVIFIVCLVVLYRKERLPKSMQGRMEKVVFQTHMRMLHIKFTLCTKSPRSPAVDKDNSTGNKRSMQPVTTGQQEEEMYATIDENYYREWPYAGSEGHKAGHKLPSILLIPDCVTSSTNDYSLHGNPQSDGNGSDDLSWGESEFESDPESSYQGERPEVPVKASLTLLSGQTMPSHDGDSVIMINNSNSNGCQSIEAYEAYYTGDTDISCYYTYSIPGLPEVPASTREAATTYDEALSVSPI